MTKRNSLEITNTYELKEKKEWNHCIGKAFGLWMCEKQKRRFI